MTEVLAPSPQVVRVDLVGSRARGEETALSDWDFRIDTTNGAALARELPTLVEPLEPLAAQWDRLTERSTYMLMLPGAVKVDLFPGDELRAIQPPWEPTPSNLIAHAAWHSHLPPALEPGTGTSVLGDGRTSRCRVPRRA